jgi:hypothetical protein
MNSADPSNSAETKLALMKFHGALAGNSAVYLRS